MPVSQASARVWPPEWGRAAAPDQPQGGKPDESPSSTRRLIAAAGREAAAMIRKSDMTEDAIDASAEAVLAMVAMVETHKALIEIHLHKGRLH